MSIVGKCVHRFTNTVCSHDLISQDALHYSIPPVLLACWNGIHEKPKIQPWLQQVLCSRLRGFFCDSIGFCPISSLKWSRNTYLKSATNHQLSWTFRICLIHFKTNQDIDSTATMLQNKSPFDRHYIVKHWCKVFSQRHCPYWVSWNVPVSIDVIRTRELSPKISNTMQYIGAGLFQISSTFSINRWKWYGLNRGFPSTHLSRNCGKCLKVIHERPSCWTSKINYSAA